MRKSCHKNAFTLAEVLITLGIIGVVAAITMPTLIQNHQKQTYVTGLKKAINMSQNMVKKMQADEGVSNVAMTKLFSEGICEIKLDSNTQGDLWLDGNLNGCEDAYGNPSVFEEMIPKYLNVVKKCRGEECNSIVYKPTYLSCQKNKCILQNYNYAYKITGSDTTVLKNHIRGFYTNDGMAYYFNALATGESYGVVNSPTLSVTVDVNGAKGPNTVGRDLFGFAIDNNGAIKYLSRNIKHEYVKHLMENGWKMDY